MEYKDIDDWEKVIRRLAWLHISPEDHARLIEIHKERHDKVGHNDYFNSAKQYVVENYKRTDPRKCYYSDRGDKKKFKKKIVEWERRLKELQELEWEPYE